MKKTYAALALAGGIVLATAIPAAAVITDAVLTVPASAVQGSTIVASVVVTNDATPGPYTIAFEIVGPTASAPVTVGTLPANVTCAAPTDDGTGGTGVSCTWDPTDEIELTATISVSIAVPATAAAGDTYSVVVVTSPGQAGPQEQGFTVTAAVVPPGETPDVPIAVPAGTAPLDAGVPTWALVGGVAVMVAAAAAATGFFARRRAHAKR